MANARIYEGTWEELSTHAAEFHDSLRLTLIVPAQDLPAHSRYRADLTPAERIRALDAAAEKNRHLPILSPDAFDRESLYAEEEELS